MQLQTLPTESRKWNSSSYFTYNSEQYISNKHKSFVHARGKRTTKSNVRKKDFFGTNYILHPPYLLWSLKWTNEVIIFSHCTMIFRNRFTLWVAVDLTVSSFIRLMIWLMWSPFLGWLETTLGLLLPNCATAYRFGTIIFSPCGANVASTSTHKQVSWLPSHQFNSRSECQTPISHKSLWF